MQKKVCVLIVDDDHEIGFMIQMILEHKGFSVITLDTDLGVEQVISEKKVDAIILDMLIGGVKGSDICKRLKNNPDYLHIPIIISTALPNAQQISIEAGANDYLSKPFEMNDLISKLNNVLKSSMS